MADSALEAERKHYLILRSLVPNNDFNAIKYLYDRLNIIDSKVSALLRINAILFSAIAIFVVQVLKDPPPVRIPLAPVPSGLTLEGELLLVAGYGVLIGSTILAFWIFSLNFDHITALPERIRTRLVQTCTQNTCKTANVCQTPASCEIKALVELDSRCTAVTSGGRAIESYEDTFFDITIRRQKALRYSYWLTVAGGVIFVLLIVRLIGPHLTHLKHAF